MDYLIVQPPPVQQPQSFGTIRQYLKAMATDFLAHELTVTDSSYDVDDEPETIPSLMKRLSKGTLDSPGYAIKEDDFCVSLWTGGQPVAHLSPKPLHLFHLIQKQGCLDMNVFSLLFEARENEWNVKRGWDSSSDSPISGFEHDLNPFSHPGISPPASWEYAYEVATLPLSKLGKLGALISKKVRGF